MSGRYILNDDHELVPCDDLMEWARWYEKADRHVGKTTVGRTYISTVFLGLDHGWGDGVPVIFETMVFGGKLDQQQDRCCTYEEAQLMHIHWVAAVQAAQPTWLHHIFWACYDIGRETFERFEYWKLKRWFAKYRGEDL
jgi:hypothetical protein